MVERWDDVVVGAGSAGCCVARRLADVGRRVLLLEAGPARPAPPSVSGMDFLGALDEPGWTWPELVAERHPASGTRPYVRGRGVGGSSAVNGLVAMVGEPDDYDRWERQLGCPGRGWSWVRPGLARARRRLPLELAAPGPVAVAVRGAAIRRRHRSGGLSVEPSRQGLLTAALTAFRGRRWSAAEAYLDDAPPHLEVRPRSPVARVLLDGGAARGVELGDGEVIEAGRVVVSAGAAHSPSLLARSGVALPGLGQDVRDHPAVAFTLDVPASGSDPARPVISHVLRWSSSVAGGRADLLLTPLERVSAAGAAPSPGAVLVGLMQVRSTGSVLDGEGRPSLLLQMLHDELDLRRLVAGVRHVVELLGSEAVGGTGAATATGPDGTPVEHLGQLDDDELARWSSAHLGHYAHLCGGCRMGGEGDGRRVVDLDGAVVGHRGLYVIDASVFPDLPRATTHLPTLAVAEQLAAALCR